MNKEATTKPIKIPMRELENIENKNDERFTLIKGLEPEKKVLFVEFEDSTHEILIVPFSSEKSIKSQYTQLIKRQGICIKKK